MNIEDPGAQGGVVPAGEAAPETLPENLEGVTPGEPAPEQTPEEKAKAEEERKKKTGSQRAREKAERLERENQALRDALARGQKPTEEAPAAKPRPADGRPDPDDPQFKSYEDYLEALTDWKVANRVQALETQRAAHAEQETFHAKLQTAHEAHPDLADLLEDLEDAGVPPPTATMHRTIQASEHGADLLYHLAKNPEESRRIGALPPVLQAVELGVILGQIKAQAAPTKPNEPKPSQAPAPPRPVKGPAGPTTDLSAIKDDNDWYKARLAKR